MSNLQLKQRIALGFLFVFAFWPVVHQRLVANYGVNPWKLAGWAMYSALPGDYVVSVYEVDQDNTLKAIDMSKGIPPEVQDEWRRLERNFHLGSLMSYESLGWKWMQIGGFQAFLLQVEVVDLNPENDRVEVVEVRRWKYMRDNEVSD